MVRTKFDPLYTMFTRLLIDKHIITGVIDGQLPYFAENTFHGATGDQYRN